MATTRGSEFEIAVLASASIKGELISIDDAVWKTMQKQFPVRYAHKKEESSRRPTLPMPEPTVVELATNFGVAMARLADTMLEGKTAFVTEAEYREREAICSMCPLWDAKARLGLGKCKAPGCGCTKFKRWIRHEKCKHPDGSKWPELSSAPVVASKL